MPPPSDEYDVSVSFCAAVLFAAGYAFMALSLRSAQYDHPPSPAAPIMQTYFRAFIPPKYIFLASYYALAGSATAASYFSAITTATRAFPQHPGLAIGIPCAIFGLSPLFLSQVTVLFRHDDDVDVIVFLAFMSVCLGLVNLLGAVGLYIPPDDGKSSTNEEPGPVVGSSNLSPRSETGSSNLSPRSETAPLLPKTAPASRPITLRAYIADPAFWLLGLVVFLAISPAEMVMASFGAIVESVLQGTPPHRSGPVPLGALRIRKTHVQVISVFNTISRLVAGALSDWLSPRRDEPAHYRRRTCYVSRLIFLGASCAILGAAWLYAASGLQNSNGLWVISVSTGIGYGVAFTLS